MQPCPGDDTITLMVCGQLEGARASALESHVADCPSCRKVLGVLQTALPHLGSGSDRLGASMLGLLAPGTRVGRYEIEDLLGAGGMGVVYAAHDPELDRKVALKLLYPSLPAPDGADGQDELAVKLRHESKTMARLRHPNVATIYDLGSYGEQLFLVMELVQGATLRAWVGEHKPWATVVATFVDAGRGLAAAHEAGIVHCDFKPDNVLLDATGRPLVTDFGLAQVVGACARPRTLEATATALGSSAIVDTAGGQVFGTPAYMAPERFDASIAADIQGDVFAFCVALYEVLYGQRPFAGATVDEVRTAITTTAAVKPPDTAAVPAWLHAVIERGLSPDRSTRYRTVPDLLDALQARPARRSPRLLVAASAVAVLALAAGGWQLTRGHAVALATCDARAELSGIWDDAQQARIKSAWTTGTTVAHAWDRTHRALDRYSDAWTGAADGVCKAPPAAATDFQRRCLRSARVQLQTVTDQFASGDPKVVAAADRTVASLPSIDDCGSSAPTTPVPSDPWMRVEVDRLRGELAAADGQSIAGKFEASSTAIDRIAARAAIVGFKPLVAEVQYSRAMNLRGAAAKPEVTTAALRDAAAQAEASGDEVLAVKAWTALAFQAGEIAGDPVRGEEYVSYAVAALERLGGNPRLETEIATTRGRIERREGKLDAARHDYEHAATLSKTDPVMYIEALSGIALVDTASGQLAKSLDENRNLLQLRLKMYGDVHPEIARSYTTLGDVTMQMGHFDEALDYYRKADDTAQRVFGPDHSIVAITAHNLGGILRSLKRPADAEREYRRAIRISTAAFGPDHPYTAKSEQSLGTALADQEKFDEALVHLRHAVEVKRKAYGDGDLETIGAINDLGYVLRDAGKIDEALVYNDKAIAGFTKAEPNSDDLVQAYEARAMTLIAGDRYREADVALAQAAAMFPHTEGPAARLTDIHTLQDLVRSKLTSRASTSARARSETHGPL